MKQWEAKTVQELQKHLNQDYRASEPSLANADDYITLEDCERLFEAAYYAPVHFRAPDLIPTLPLPPPVVLRSKAGQLLKIYGKKGESSCNLNSASPLQYQCWDDCNETPRKDLARFLLSYNSETCCFVGSSTFDKTWDGMIAQYCLGNVLKRAFPGVENPITLFLGGKF